MFKHATAGILIIFTTVLTVNAWDGPPPQKEALTRYAFTEPHMGTAFRIVLFAPDETTATKAAKAAFERITELNRIMSDYDDDSELMKLCKKSQSKPTAVSVDLYRALERAVELGNLTDGAFDVSIGPVVRLWRKARRTRALPDAEALKKALELVDYRKIRLTPQGRMVQLLLMGMLLDLGGIAKGYAAEEALAVLGKHGLKRAMVQAGGDIVVGDSPPDAQGWKIAIAPLKQGEEPKEFLSLRNAGVSTSGDLHQYVEIDGKRYSHIIDPKTGLGLVGRRSVTIIRPNGLSADGWPTAVCVLGPERGLKLIEAQKGMAALLMFETDRGVETTATRNFVNYRWKEPK